MENKQKFYWHYYLQQFKPTMLFVEHDRKFIEQIAARVIQIEI